MTESKTTKPYGGIVATKRSSWEHKKNEALLVLEKHEIDLDKETDEGRTFRTLFEDACVLFFCTINRKDDLPKKDQVKNNLVMISNSGKELLNKLQEMDVVTQQYIKYGDKSLTELVAILEHVSRSASTSLQILSDQKGKPVESPLPPPREQLISVLIYLYETSTQKAAGVSRISGGEKANQLSGPFFKLVKNCLAALGVHVGDEAIKKSISKAKAWRKSKYLF